MLEGKVAIVTGGSRGIGLEIAKELSSQGADVIICSRGKEQLNNAVKGLSSGGRKAFGIVVDVSKFEDCQKLVEYAFSQKGRVDILVNNAGIFGPVGLLETTDPEVWNEILSVNLLGAVYCSQLVIPNMKKQGGGKIINLAGAGVGGTQTLPRFIGYRVSKAAVVEFTENLAAELQDQNIQVNAIAPGAVASELTLSLLKMDKDLVGEDMYQTSKQLLEQGGTPPELSAKLVAFLVSEKANHISGRLLSAKWNKIEHLKDPNSLTSNLYKLRRIDNELFIEKK